MFVKLMGSGDPLPERHPSRSYQLIEALSVEFKREPDGACYALVVDPRGVPDSHRVFGKAFVLNRNGDTIDTFTELAPNGAGRQGGKS